MEIRPNIHWIEGRASNFYLCVDEDGLTLIDAGMPKEAQLVWDAVDNLGFDKRALRRILVTHADIDHVGSLADIQAGTGARVFAGAETAVYLQSGKSPNHLPRLAQWFVNIFMKYKSLPADVIESVVDGDNIPGSGGVQALATPGHTTDHFSFFMPATGVLFVGDAMNTRDGRIQRTPKRITADEDAANRSAIRLLELAPVTIACGHGRPLSDHKMGDLMQFFNTLRRKN